MPKCGDCGNTKSFREPQTEWQLVDYDEDGEIENTEHICYDSSDEDVECNNCDGTNIDWV